MSVGGIAFTTEPPCLLLYYSPSFLHFYFGLQYVELQVQIALLSLHHKTMSILDANSSAARVEHWKKCNTDLDADRGVSQCYHYPAPIHQHHITLQACAISVITRLATRQHLLLLNG